MKYYYLHPWNPRFFFPEGFKKHPLFLSICCPYAWPAKVSWRLFRYLPLYCRLFAKKSIEAYVPERAIRALIGDDALLAFNAGTHGPEQKPTALGWDGADYFFLKYAHTPPAVKNVKNEHETLQRIADLDFVPCVLGFFETDGAVLLKTSVVQGDGIPAELSSAVLNILDQLADRSAGEGNDLSEDLRHGFAHGDFCPWNMVQRDGKFWVYDWEMARIYPLGYDLFTYIFQTAFLLSPQKSIEAVIEENRQSIERFFEQAGIADWCRYLEAFAQAKLDYIKTQGDKGLLDAYTRLFEFSDVRKL
jgi:hypothetical protein